VTGPAEARGTHVALPVQDLDGSIAFYTSYTPLVVIETFADDAGRSAWLSHDRPGDSPFVLVLVMFNAGRDVAHPVLGPFAHIGIEVPSRRELEELAERARSAGCLIWEPRDLPAPVGYVCALSDPDGNVIEISHDQGVYAAVRRRFGQPGAGA
jgi:lactoylglutathione lyase